MELFAIRQSDGWMKVFDAAEDAGEVEIDVLDGRHLEILHEVRDGSGGGAYCALAVEPMSRAEAAEATRKTIAAVGDSGAVRSTNVVTITTTAVHGFEVGDKVIIAGVTPTGETEFNGEFTVASVPSTTTFTYSQTADDDTGGGGTVSRVIEAAHHGDNKGVKTQVSATSYNCIWYWVRGFCRLSLAVDAETPGISTVWARVHEA